MSNKTMVESIKDWLNTCPFLVNGKINVDYLPNKQSYSISLVPVTPILQLYADGGSIRQIQFNFTSNEDLDGSLENSIANSRFYEDLQNWIDEQVNISNFPVFENQKDKAIGIIITNSNYLIDITQAGIGRYQITMQLQYERSI
ncbi:hypothetical protein [Anaerofustis stercorihominis]|uniref:hypothetical protein n=1 Tax=Anaerofustis stercorihominis TaxID=214853 RepID=UPI0039966B4C